MPITKMFFLVFGKIAIYDWWYLPDKVREDKKNKCFFSGKTTKVPPKVSSFIEEKKLDYWFLGFFP